MDHEGSHEDNESFVNPSVILSHIINLLPKQLRRSTPEGEQDAVTLENCDDEGHASEFVREEEKMIESGTFLWDISVIPEHAQTLKKHGIIQIAHQIIIDWRDHSNRLNEVIIGIMANLCSSNEVPSSLFQTSDIHEITPSLTLRNILLECDDSLTLSEVLRLFSVTLYCQEGSPYSASTSAVNIFREQLVQARLKEIIERNTNSTLLERTSGLLLSLLFRENQFCSDYIEGGIYSAVIHVVRRAEHISSETVTSMLQIIEMMTTLAPMTHHLKRDQERKEIMTTMICMAKDEDAHEDTTAVCFSIVYNVLVDFPEEIDSYANEMKKCIKMYEGAEGAIEESLKIANSSKKSDHMGDATIPLEEGTWSCERCTFINLDYDLTCNACYLVRTDTKDVEVTWQWAADPTQWIPYDMESNMQIEEAFQNGDQEVALSKGWFKNNGGYILYLVWPTSQFPIEGVRYAQINRGGNLRMVRRIARNEEGLFEDVDASTYRTEKCMVCQVEFEEGDVVKLPVCTNHYFHRECILQWLKLKDHCPYCHLQLYRTA
ncbi:phosphatidylinositol 4-kinase [Planoprotostelium fungivorum]|uniref:Phosphatidylinositol 4-kinase n=1 Tax=Planoprotostelium fungivorum TaxID=1890364 RepID=A0A2P6N0R1_9EUKA|nr:phosphatidylinositol 4-kinase [Planoprotostelium fungivorum]